MPEINQLTLSLHEILVLMIKNADIHEGNWTLGVQWQLGMGNYGPTPAQTFPGAAVTMSGMGIQKLPDGPLPTMPGAVAVDAAKVNPAPSKASKRGR